MNRQGDATRAFYDRISPVYDTLADAGERHARERGLELLAARPGDTVLEVGFGTGHGLRSLAEAVGPAGHVFGVELSEGMYDVAHRRLEEASLLDRVGLRLGDARALPFPDHRFDAAFLSFTLELFAGGDIPVVLGEFRRVLRHAGRLAVVAMDARQPGGPMVDLYRWLHRHFPHIVDCRPIQVRTLMEAAGFEVRRLEELSILTLPVACLLAVPSAG